jgi:hypothetical protein
LRFPAYWSRATAEQTDAEGETRSFSCWRWSDVSPQDAFALAREAAERILRKFVAGEPRDRYGYGARPLREEVLQRFNDASGNLLAAITRNAWGALVLNAAGLTFIDIDFPQIGPWEPLGHYFRKWFDKTAVPPDVVRQRRALEQLSDFLRDRPHWCVRVYRTFHGLRVAVLHEPLDPASDETLSWLQAAGCDPLYIRLCREQQCFRARLTPKPWRCRHQPCHVRWPFEKEEDREAFDRWQKEYLEKQAAYATCRYLDTLGQVTMHADFGRIIELHDQLTRAAEPLPLA